MGKCLCSWRIGISSTHPFENALVNQDLVNISLKQKEDVATHRCQRLDGFLPICVVLQESVYLRQEILAAVMLELLQLRRFGRKRLDTPFEKQNEVTDSFVK